MFNYKSSSIVEKSSVKKSKNIFNSSRKFWIASLLVRPQFSLIKCPRILGLETFLWKKPSTNLIGVSFCVIFAHGRIPSHFLSSAFRLVTCRGLGTSSQIVSRRYRTSVWRKVTAVWVFASAVVRLRTVWKCVKIEFIYFGEWLIFCRLIILNPSIFYSNIWLLIRIQPKNTKIYHDYYLFRSLKILSPWRNLRRETIFDS